MPPYLTHLETWKALWPLPLATVLLSLFLLQIIPKENRKESFLLLLAFSLLGIVTGYLTGFSRESAVGTVLPAVLSLIGGLAIFLVVKDKITRIYVSMAVLSFSLSLVLGTSWGAVMRETAEEFKISERYLKSRALIESDVRKYRKNLGLSEKK